VLSSEDVDAWGERRPMDRFPAPRQGNDIHTAGADNEHRSIGPVWLRHDYILVLRAEPSTDGKHH
jgi:hypothetical protein